MTSTGARLTRTCPGCSEEVLAVARICKHCETRLTPLQVTEPSTASNIAAPAPPTNQTRACPACGERILAVARKCKHCETLLDAPSGVSLPARPQSPRSQAPQARAGSSTPAPADTRSQPHVLPRLFAAIGGLVALAAGAIHYQAWQNLQALTQQIERHRGETLPLVPVAASLRAWRLYDSLAGAAATSLLSGTIAAGLLVIVSWGLWHHRWWAPRAVLLWSSLVGCMIVSDFVMTQQFEEEVFSAEDDAMQAFVGHMSDWLGAPKETVAIASMPVMIPWIDRMFLGAFNAKVDFALSSALMSYAFGVAWFPASITLLFCRRGARRYFRQRDGIS